MFYLTEEQRLKAIAICDEIQASIARLDEQMAAAKKAADDYLAKFPAEPKPERTS